LDVYVFAISSTVRYVAVVIGLIAATIATIATSEYGKSWPKPRLWVATSLFLVTCAGLINFPTGEPEALHTSFLWDRITKDDQLFHPGDRFQKSWRMFTLSGIPRGSELRLTSGQIKTTNIRMENDIGPATDYDLTTADVFAPATPGCYRNMYRFFKPGSPPQSAPKGSYGFGDEIYIQIRVALPGHEREDFTVFIDDENIRDSTVIPAGEDFEKGWILHNCSDNLWENYRAKRVGGDFGLSDIPLPVVAPHQDFTLRARMTAPVSTGSKTGIYRLQDANGTLFGSEFTFNINVK
jgi:hypothetical protein